MMRSDRTLGPEFVSALPCTPAELAALTGRPRSVVAREFRLAWLDGLLMDTGARRGAGTGRERWVYDVAPAPAPLRNAERALAGAERVAGWRIVDQAERLKALRPIRSVSVEHLPARAWGAP
jgi:hypothetical protein